MESYNAASTQTYRRVADTEHKKKTTEKSRRHRPTLVTPYIFDYNIYITLLIFMKHDETE